jgi:hypothetical protein
MKMVCLRYLKLCKRMANPIFLSGLKVWILTGNRRARIAGN